MIENITHFCTLIMDTMNFFVVCTFPVVVFEKLVEFIVN